ncbi:MAG: EAL domain-containing protein [Oscillibacter sp.]|nr:EAL domain-containing protein [Oscillibacter sp.]
MKDLWKMFTTGEFTQWKREINRENRLAIHMLAVAGLPLSIANIFAQTFFVRMELFTLRTMWLLLYFTVLGLFERFIMPRDCHRSTVLLYILEAPVMIVAILLGTVWDPNHQALTFLLFLTVMPVFVFDRPQRLLGVSGGWAAAFLTLCLLVKDPSTLRGDFFHTIEFFLASAAVTLVTLRVRLEAMRSFAATRYHLEHDASTGLFNRRSLEERASGYIGKKLFVIFVSLDHIDVYNDFYGQNTGDQMLKCLAETLREAFGESHTYRYGGDEFACMAEDVTEDDILSRLARVREQLRRRKFNDHTLSLTCSAGYSAAVPESEKEVLNIIRLSDIYSHRARRKGEGQTIGGPYDDLHLRSAITDSRIASLSREQETNQLTELHSLPVFIARATEMKKGGMLEESRRPMLGFFHIIHFRDFNEEFGYAKGDALINHTAKLLIQAFRDRYICNITGPQFGVLCYQEEIQPALEQVAAGLQRYRQDYPIVTKAGFVDFGSDESIISLLDKAKAAHDAIYHKPDAAFCYYDEKMDAENHFRQYLVSHLDEAIEKGWLRVYYQPIIRAFTGCICNEEALSRWDDPNYGFLSPIQFIPLLEENHLIYKVSLHIVRQILEDFRRKEARGIAPVPVSVNLSRYDFQECDMVQAITDLVDRSGYDRSLIRIEITESALMNDQELLAREVNRFHQNGFEVWMDDFGSEYSTLNLLQNLNFDLIKIDMEFMKNFTASGKNMIIVSNVINMAQRMGVRTLVEGIETEEHFRLLRKLGCEKLQGFLFSKPSTLDHLMEWALSNETIRYESGVDASYYDAVSGVDLSAPHIPDARADAMRSGDAGHLPEVVPTGVLEYRKNRFVCLRGNDSFFLALQEAGLLSAARMGTGLQSLTNPPPHTLAQAAARGNVTGEWETVRHEDGESAVMMLRRVSHNAEIDCTAFLVVFLPRT